MSKASLRQREYCLTKQPTSDAQLYAEILDFISRNKIVCPLPIPWEQFFDVIWKSERRQIGDSTLGFREMGLMPPLILAGWEASKESKVNRFRQHLDWAHQKGRIAQAHRLLNELNDKDFLFESHSRRVWIPLHCDS